MRELSVVHVSLNSASPLFCVTDTNIDRTTNRPQNKQSGVSESSSLAAVKQCITAFRNLSTIRLVYFPRQDWNSPDLVSPESVPVWNEVKDAAIAQLKGSSVDGPKKLKTITPVPGLWTRNGFDPKGVVEEIVV